MGKKLHWATTAIFAAFSLIMLAGVNYDYLRVLEDQSIFLPTKQFFKECAELPGSLNTWLAAFLTQFFYHPWLGGTIFTLLLTALALIVYRAFRIPERWYAIAFVPSALLLLSTLSWGYIIFSLKPTNVVMGLATGIFFATCAYWGYRSIKQPWIRAIALCVLVVLGYYAFGFYGLFSALLCCAHEVSCSRRPWNWAISAMGVALIVGVPLLTYRYGIHILMKHDIFTTGLPQLLKNEGEKALGIPYFLAMAILLLYSVLSAFWKSQPMHPHRCEGISVASFFVALLAVVSCRYQDANFNASAAMLLDISDGEWEKALEHRERLKEPPTRLNVLFTNIALMRTGQAGDRMFEYENDAAPIASPRKANALRDAGSIPISFHFGRNNNAVRWAMEYKVEYGLRLQYLKYMIKTALLNGEYSLAQKYNNTLAQTMFHKAAAAEFQQLINNPQLIQEHPELKQIQPLMMYRDHLGGDGGKIEAYVLPIVASLRGGTPELMQLALQCNLMTKNVDDFMERFAGKARQYDRIPKHYQEATLLWCMLHKNEAYRALNIDPATLTRFKQFNAISRAHNEKTLEQKREIMKPLFGDTYWYYYFLADDLKTH